MKVLRFPHPILKHHCKPVQKINRELRDWIAEMFQTMYETEGVGLAANQVGLPFRLFVMNPTGDPEKPEEEHVFINPVILKKSGKIEDNEGCLSFPGIHADVLRSESIDVEAIDLKGEVFRFQWKGHPARIVQHETDHLNGVGFVERLSPAALLEIKEDIEELKMFFESDRARGFIPSDEEIAREIEELEKKFC